MIRFECKCRHVFEVPPEMAGDSIQCPQCGLLVDVPVLSELKGLDDEGMYKVGADDTLKESDRLAQLNRAFANTRVDEDGNEIDMRTTMEEFANVGTEDETFELADEARPATPKYDPVTGELIRPIDVQEDDRPKQTQVPMATSTLNYARARQSRSSDVTPATALAMLFGPENLVVIMFVFLIHAFSNFLFIGPALAAALLAHYSNVVDETGPEERDEMPRPFRHMSLSEDLWGPFVHFAFALLYSYAPLFAIGFLELKPAQAQICLIITFAMGSVIFPGVLLTTTTSGTTLNLRPDIVWMTIRRSGPIYIWAVIIWILTAPVYFVGIGASFFRSVSLLAMGKIGHAQEWLLSYAGLIAGIILMHYFCWLLGLIYRAHQPDFPWVLQRHFRVTANEASAVIDARQRAAQHRRESNQALRQMRGGL